MYQSGLVYLRSIICQYFLLELGDKARVFFFQEDGSSGLGLMDFPVVGRVQGFQPHPISQEKTHSFSPMVPCHLRGFSCSHYLISIVNLNCFCGSV